MFNCDKTLIGQTDRQFIQTYTYSTSQHKLYKEIYHVLHLHLCEIKNGQISVSLTVTIDQKDIVGRAQN